MTTPETEHDPLAALDFDTPCTAGHDEDAPCQNAARWRLVATCCGHGMDSLCISHRIIVDVLVAVIGKNVRNGTPSALVCADCRTPLAGPETIRWEALP